MRSSWNSDGGLSANKLQTHGQPPKTQNRGALKLPEWKIHFAMESKSRYRNLNNSRFKTKAMIPDP